MAAPSMATPPCSACTKHKADIDEWSKQMRLIAVSLVRLLRQMNPKPVSNAPISTKKPSFSADLHGTSSSLSSPANSSDLFQHAGGSDVLPMPGSFNGQNGQEKATRSKHCDDIDRASGSSSSITVITIPDSPENPHVQQTSAASLAQQPSGATDSSADKTSESTATPVQKASENTDDSVQSTIDTVVNAIHRKRPRANSTQKVMIDKVNQKAPSGIDNNVEKAPPTVTSCVRIAPNVNANPTQKDRLLHVSLPESATCSKPTIYVLPPKPRQDRVLFLSPNSANHVQMAASTVVKPAQNLFNVCQIVKRHDGAIANTSQTLYRVTTSSDQMAPNVITGSWLKPPETTVIPHQTPIRVHTSTQTTPIATVSSTNNSSEVVQHQNPFQAANFADPNMTIPDYMQLMGVNGNTALSPLEIVENMTKAAMLQEHPEAPSSSTLQQQTPIDESPTSPASWMPFFSNMFHASSSFSYSSTDATSKTDSDHTCVNCSTNETSIWRRTPDGADICTACYSYKRRNGVNRPADMPKQPVRKRRRKCSAKLTNSAVLQD